MKTLLKISAFLFIYLFTISCSRDDSTSSNNSNTPNVAAGFTWKENSQTATDKTAATSELRTQYKSIFAFANADGTGTLFEINLKDVIPGTYDFAVAGNSFYMQAMAPGTITGKLIITANSASKASGTFEAFSTGTTGVTKVYGTFTNITVK
jgi:hypothetical protein